MTAGTEQAALTDLREHWGSAYDIRHSPGGHWTALRHGALSRDRLSAATHPELRRAIRADYHRRTVGAPAGLAPA